MKNFFLLSALVLTVLAQPAFAGVYNIDQDYDDYPPEHQRVEISERLLTRNSFFFEMNVGLGSQAVDGYVYKNHSVVGAAFDGSGLFWGFNVGLNFKRWFATTLGFNMTNGTGHASFDGPIEKIEDFDFYNFSINLGIKVFPFRNVDGLENLFAGLAFGTGVVNTDHENWSYDYMVSEGCVNLTIELGYLWNLTPRWGVGIKGFLGFDNFIEYYSYYDDDYYSDYDEYEMRDMSGVKLGLAATLIRR